MQKAGLGNTELTEKDVVKEVDGTGSGPCRMIDFGTNITEFWVQLDEMTSVASLVTGLQTS